MLLKCVDTEWQRVKNVENIYPEQFLGTALSTQCPWMPLGFGEEKRPQVSAQTPELGDYLLLWQVLRFIQNRNPQFSDKDAIHVESRFLT